VGWCPPATFTNRDGHPGRSAWLHFWKLSVHHDGRAAAYVLRPRTPKSLRGNCGSQRTTIAFTIEQLAFRTCGGKYFTQAAELFFDQLREEAIADESLRQAATANTLDNFRYVFVKALEGLFIDRMEQNEELFAKYMNDSDFKKLASEHLLRQVYHQIREGAA
jgi:hypothetical protein